MNQTNVFDKWEQSACATATAKDRLMAEQDYLVNTIAEEEMKAIMDHLEQQDEAMIDLLQRMEEQRRVIISGFAAMGFNGNGTPAPA